MCGSALFTAPDPDLCRLVIKLRCKVVAADAVVIKNQRTFYLLQGNRGIFYPELIISQLYQARDLYCPVPAAQGHVQIKIQA